MWLTMTVPRPSVKPGRRLSGRKRAVQHTEELAEQDQDPDPHHDLRDDDWNIKRNLREWLQPEVISLQCKRGHGPDDRGNDGCDERDGQGVLRGARVTSLFLESSQNQWKGPHGLCVDDASLQSAPSAEARDKTLEAYIGSRGIEGIQHQNDDRHIQKSEHQDGRNDHDRIPR